MSRLPILSLIAGLAVSLWLVTTREQSPLVAADAAAPTSEVNAKNVPVADALLGQVIDALDGRSSIAARLHLGINLYGHQLTGTGVYLEQDPRHARKVRFEISTRVGNGTAETLFISDGHLSWMNFALPSEKSLVRHDLSRIAQAMSAAADTPGLDHAGWWQNMGGVSKLLRRLRQLAAFDAVQPSVLNQVPVWKVQGPWGHAMLALLMPDQQAAVQKKAPFDCSKLLPHVPDRIVMYIGQEDLFPYRLEFWRDASPQRDKRDRLSGQTGILYCLQFLEVRIDGPIDAALFKYNPGNLTPNDQTDVYLQYRGLLNN